MVVNVEMQTRLNSLEYWILKPFHIVNDRDVPYVKQVVGLLQELQTQTLHSDEYDRILSDLEAVYQGSKMQYQYVERRQTEKAIKTMGGSVISRIISKNIIPVTTKVVETVKPTVSKTLNETVLPAANKALVFMHKTFAKKKRIEVTEATEVNQESTERT